MKERNQKFNPVGAWHNKSKTKNLHQSYSLNPNTVVWTGNFNDLEEQLWHIIFSYRDFSL